MKNLLLFSFLLGFACPTHAYYKSTRQFIIKKGAKSSESVFDIFSLYGHKIVVCHKDTKKCSFTYHCPANINLPCKRHPLFHTMECPIVREWGGGNIKTGISFNYYHSKCNVYDSHKNFIMRLECSSETKTCRSINPLI